MSLGEEGDVHAMRASAFVWTLLAAVCAAPLLASIVVFYEGARFVMSEGGFVASGGPYVIAHPAPGWIWIMPVSIMAGLLLLGVHTMAARRANGFRLLGFMWVALFGSLGWAFLDFGFNHLEDGLVWGWIVCGVAFWLMALPVVIVWLGALMPGVRERLLSRLPAPPSPRERSPWNVSYLMAHLVALPLGVYLGALFFGAVSG